MDKDCLQEILTVAEAAAEWGIEEEALRRACQRGAFRENEVRKSGQTWLLTRAGMERRFGAPRPAGASGTPLRDLLGNYGLTRVSDALAKRDQFQPGELWREGRHWMVDPRAMDRVFRDRPRP